MRKLFLLILLISSTLIWATQPSITIDGDKSDWAEVPMLSQPGTWPMLKVLPAADADMGTNALAFMLENTEDFDPTWGTYTTHFIDKDYDVSTTDGGTYNWQYPQMGVDYKCTYGVSSPSWISFPKAMSANNKYFEIGIPASWLTDLGSKFGFALYYGSGTWYCPDYSTSAHPEIKDQKGFLYKTRSYTTLPGTVTTANAYAHPTMGECVDYVDFGMRDNGNDTARWAAYPVELVTPGVYSVTTNVTSTNSWKFEFWLVDVASNAVVAHIDAPSSNVSSSKTSYTFGLLDLRSIPAGKYMLKVKNRTRNSTVKLNSIDIAYVGGAVQTITNTSDFETDLNEAWYSTKGERADGKISFPGDEVATSWVRWNIHVQNSDYYDIIVNFEKGSGDNNVGVKIYNESTTVFDKHVVAIGSQTGATSPKTLGRAYLPVGDYVMEYTNPVSWSSAKIMSVEAKAFVAPTIALPNSLPAASAITSELAYADEGELYFTPEDKEGYILDQWAQWKVSVASAGSTFLFTMQVSSADESTQSYKISILDSEANEVAVCTRKPSHGAQTLTHYFYFAEAGNYIVKVQNTTKWSNGHMVSLVVSIPSDLLELRDDATTNAVIDANKNVAGKKIQTIRTIKGGMLNPICLPFGVSDNMVKNVFGEDVELYVLNEATIDETGFILNLNFTPRSDIYQGVPQLIKTSRDIVNPVFDGVEIAVTEVSSTHKSKADFIGTFVQMNLDANPNILYVGANNNLYYPTETMQLKGLRAYFLVHDTPSGAPIRGARIVSQEDAATDIEFVSSDENQTSKTVQKILQNGQIFIIRDGVRYNVMGVRIQ